MTLVYCEFPKRTLIIKKIRDVKTMKFVAAFLLHNDHMNGQEQDKKR